MGQRMELGDDFKNNFYPSYNCNYLLKYAIDLHRIKCIGCSYHSCHITRIKESRRMNDKPARSLFQLVPPFTKKVWNDGFSQIALFTGGPSNYRV